MNKTASSIFSRKNGIKEMVLPVFLLAVIFLFTRLFLLTTIPAGLHVDEVGMAYDAWNLSRQGTDRYLNYLPVYLLNYGDGQSALYAYLAALCMKLLGPDILAIRLPAVFGGALVLIFGAMFVKDCLGKRQAFLFGLFVCICPYFIMASRIGLDCNLMLGFFTASAYLLYRAVKTEKGAAFFLAGLFFGITLYTYSLSWLVVPLFLLMSLIYLIRLKKITVRNFFLFVIPLGILALPLMLFLAVNMGFLGQINLPFMTIPKLLDFRGSEFSLKNIAHGLEMIKSIFTFGPLTYNAFPEFGTLYYLSIPFLVVGIVMLVKRCYRSWKGKEWCGLMFVGFMAAAVLVCGLFTYDSRVINKSNAIFFPMAVFLVLGAESLFHIRRSLGRILLAGYGVMFLLFVHFYFFQYQEKVYPEEYFDDNLMAVTEYLEENYPEETKYMDTTGAVQGDLYILWTAKIPADVFMREVRRDAPRNYDGYCTFYPEEVDLDGIYVVKNKTEIIPELLKAGFTEKEYRGYLIYEYERDEP